MSSSSFMSKPLEIQKAVTVDQIRSCYRVMCQLRPHFIEEAPFIEQVQRQLTEGYQLVYCQDRGEVKAAVGFRFLEFLAWGKVLYIDDLVTDAEARKVGYGGRLLKWVIEQAREKGCDQVHLDSGPQRHEAHRLYLNHGFKIIGYHFALDFKNLS
jgi:GNAT superfamily N-acetyltransferase